MAGTEVYQPPETVAMSSRTSVGALFRIRARAAAAAVAVVDGDRTVTYGELNERVNRLANGLAGLGVGHGDRIGLLARNCLEYVEVELAAAKIGAITAAQNWRLSDRELTHCINLATPVVIVCQEDYAETLDRLDLVAHSRLLIGEAYERLIARSDDKEPSVEIDPEDGLIILYTSGTTGLPKGAVISHRAMMCRAMVYASELCIPYDDPFIAWPPFFHMASTDQALATLMRGGRVVVIDGYRPDALIDIIAHEKMRWLILIPGMVEPFIQAFRASGATAKGLGMIGAMADLIPRQQIAEITTLLQAPYLNTFGATETGIPPANGSTIPIGVAPENLAKRQCSFCEIRLVDADGRDVADGTDGELAMRGPTLFSGYWNADETNRHDFREGWFHMGDVFRRNPDGSLDFIDRVKYLIKSGGENIYPAEIEQVIMADPRIADAVVVRKPDARWGEVPVAFVARRDDSLDAEQILSRCRRDLAGYKQPKEVRFIAFDDLPRSTSGKIQRHALEASLAEE